MESKGDEVSKENMWSNTHGLSIALHPTSVDQRYEGAGMTCRKCGQPNHCVCDCVADRD